MVQAEPSYLLGAADIWEDAPQYSFLTYSSGEVTLGCWYLL